MKKYTTLIVIGAIVLVLGIWLGVGYNSMLSSELEVEKSWGNVESQYQRRKDLIPNLEKTVKAFARHEEKTYTEVVKARTAAQRAQQAADMTAQAVPDDDLQMERYMQAQDQAKKALDIYVNAVTEAYPELRSSQNFLDFQENLTGTENRIQVARANYNEAVQTYNKKVRSFPNVLISGIFGFSKKSMFKADADAALAPQVFEE
ncbi:MAG: LemA family protein [Muribaculaceae bacterium]|nr:LemA family protein [Muribaculaceae bacterium]